jgi:hypothetical protein
VPSSNKKSKQARLQFLTPVLLVLMIASMLVYIKVLPDLPEIAEATEDFREDQNALVEAPPLPETDTSNVAFTDPDIFEPEQPVQPGNENVTPEDIEPSGRSKTLAGIVDALIFLVIAVIGGFGIYLLFKLRKRMTIKAVFGTLLMVVAFATCAFFGFMVYRMVFYQTGLDITEFQLMTILTVVSAPIGIFISYSLFSGRVPIEYRNFALLLIGALMGSFLAALLPLYGVIPLVITISLFDIYSVRQGPIKKIMSLGEDDSDSKKPESTAKKAPEPAAVEAAPEAETSPASKSKPATPKPKPAVSIEDDTDLMMLYEAPEWSIGIGDFVIYSMFAAFTLTHMLQFLPYYGFYTPLVGFVLPWLVFLITTTGLLVGYTYTLKLLSRKELLPGLPLAVAFGLIAFLGSLGVMEIVNLLAYGKFAPIV